MSAVVCQMTSACAAPVAMLDRKGYTYCRPHGLQRRAGGTPCRTLRPHELARLAAGQQVTHY